MASNARRPARISSFLEMVGHAPLAIPSLALLCGCAAGFALDSGQVASALPLCGALAGAGLAWGGRSGASLVSVAVGLLAALSHSGLSTTPPASIDTDRPVVVVGRLTDDWHQDVYGWRASMRVSHLRQGATVAIWTREIRIALSGRTRPVTGTPLRARGYLGRARPLMNGWRDNPRPWTLRIKSVRFLSPAPGDRGTLARRVADEIARRLESGLAILDGSSGAVVESLLLGRPEALGRDVRQQLRRVGLAHLFAVSGLHVALLAGAVFALSRPLNPSLRRALVIVVVLLYALLTGTRPATIRATLMTVVALLASTMRRSAAALQGLAVAVMLMVLTAPDVVQDLGFQLSASATAGIVCLGPALRKRWAALPGWLATSLAATAGAQLGSGPVTLSQFGLLYPAGALLNLVAIPWLAAVLATAFSWAALCLVDPPAGLLLRPLLEMMVRPLSMLASFPVTPLLTWPVSMKPASALLAVTSLTAALLLRKRPGARIALGATFLLLVRAPPVGPGGELTLFDVGQGDAILLRDGRSAMMIDGGGWAGGDIAASVLLRSLASRGVRSLDGAMVTHGDTDHCRGVLDLAAYIPVNLLFSAPIDDEGRCVEALAALPNARWVASAAGDRHSLGRWSLQVLHPPADSVMRGNDRSLVVEIEGFGHDILLTGDIEVGAELALRRRWGPSLRSGILKVAHHGSRTSSHPAFITAVSPRLALVSAGKGNRYDHPSKDVLDRFRRAGARILRTDRDGMISLRFSSDGRLSIRTEGPT